MRARADLGRAGPVFVNALYETASRKYSGVLEGIYVQVAFRKSRSNKALQLTAHHRFQLRYHLPSSGASVEPCRSGWAAAERLIRWAARSEARRRGMR